MTAGLVMGIMLIPFVSSLSDDIITRCRRRCATARSASAPPVRDDPRSILPAALPGIVGAILLAASRAIGETMIVVLGAGRRGAADAQPVRGDDDGDRQDRQPADRRRRLPSPETLVAFALGLTLFVITLGLNIVALYIVRKYREQYE